MSEMDAKVKYQSKITKKVIDLTGVNYTFNDRVFVVKNSQNQENVVKVPECVNIAIQDNKLTTSVDFERYIPVCGTINRLINNAVVGIKTPFTNELKLVGVGYKVTLGVNSTGRQEMSFNVGYSHPVILEVPNGIQVQCKTPVNILLSSFDKQLVTSFARYLSCKVRKYNVYSGKGILRTNCYYKTKEKKKK